MIEFTSHEIVDSQINMKDHLYIVPGERCWAGHENIYAGLEGQLFHNTGQKYANTKDLFGALGIPQDLAEFYPEIKFVCTNGGQAPNQRKRVLVPCKEFQKYIVNRAKALDLLNVFRSSVPYEFASINEETIARFTHIINKERGADISCIHFFVTEFERIQGSYSWSTWVACNKFIVTDNKLNPIDVDKLIQTISEICVKK